MPQMFTVGSNRYFNRSWSFGKSNLNFAVRSSWSHADGSNVFASVLTIAESAFRRGDDVLPDSIDRGPLVLVDQRAEGLDQPPHGGADPHRVRAVDFAVHRAAGLRVPARPDGQVQTSLDPEVNRRHAAKILGIVVRDRGVRLQLAAVRPDVFDEVRAANLFLAFGQDDQVHGHLVDVADRLPGKEMVR